PVHTAVCRTRIEGASINDVGLHESATGSYRPPVFKACPMSPASPPQTIMTSPVQTAVRNWRATGAFAVDVGLQVSRTGSYRPPVFCVESPPHTISWL